MPVFVHACGMPRSGVHMLRGDLAVYCHPTVGVVTLLWLLSLLLQAHQPRPPVLVLPFESLQRHVLP